MLDEREKQPEMDCQTDFSKESSVTIQCSSESSNMDSPRSSSSTAVLNTDKQNDESIFKTKHNSSAGPPLRTGRWTPDEKILFLYGLRMFGKGRWKKMSVYLPQRSLVQIKSHAQKVLKRQQAGENIFRRLEENYNEIDNLVVQAARQRDALRMAGINVNSSATKPRKNILKRAMKKKSFDARIKTTGAISPPVQESVYQQPIKNTTVPVNHTSDSSVLAAAALCQLSSIGGSWDQRDTRTMISGKSQQATV